MFVNVDNLQKGGGQKKIEEMYQKKSPLEHILLRPDTYIGSVEFTDPTVNNEALKQLGMK